MRHKAKPLVLLGALLPFLAVSASAEPIIRDAVTMQEITQPLNTAMGDDYLLGMARATSLNVLADASNFPTSPVKAYPSTPGAIAGPKGEYADKWGPVLINVMADFVAQQKLSTLRTDARTFLFWSEPEPRSLFSLQQAVTQATDAAYFAEWVAAAKAEGVPEKEVIKAELPEEQLHRLLRAYLKKQHNWTGSIGQNTDKVDLQTHFDDLPPSLRALVLLDLRRPFVQPANDQLLQNDFWNSTDVRLRAEKTGEMTTVKVQYLLPYKGSEALYKLHFTTLKGPVTPAVPDDAPPTATPPQEVPIGPTQLGTNDTLINAYTSLPDDASQPQLNADAKLQSPISIEVKRLPLRDLLVKLEQQSGVRFTLQPDAPTDKLVTARVEKMPLSKFMGLLSRVYGVKWDKADATTYQMRGNDQGQLHLQLLPVGDPEQYRQRYVVMSRPDREDENVALVRAVAHYAGLEALQSPEGAPTSSLPQPLRERLRRAVEDPIVELQFRSLYNANRMLAEQLAQKGLILRFGLAGNNEYRRPYGGLHMSEPADMLRFSVQSDDGRMVLPVFNSYVMPVAQPGEQPVRPASRRR